MGTLLKEGGTIRLTGLCQAKETPPIEGLLKGLGTVSNKGYSTKRGATKRFGELCQMKGTLPREGLVKA